MLQLLAGSGQNFDRGEPRELRPTGGVVPGSTIVGRGGNSVVFMIDDDRTHARSVTAGQRYGEFRLIEDVANGTPTVRIAPADMCDVPISTSGGIDRPFDQITITRAARDEP